MKILLIAGGWSSERDVSLSAVPGLAAALEELGHTVAFFDLLEGFDRLTDAAREHDFAFINLHGAPGEDGLVQALLDRAGCPYNGAGPAGSFLALNKAAAKQIFRAAGLPTADWEYLPQQPAEDWEPRMAYPIFVKSCMGGSSLRLGRAGSRGELDALMSDIFAHGESVLLEPALPGRDVTCAVLGDEALPPILILPQMGDYFDFASKYSDGGAREICPAPIPEDVTRRMQEMTLTAVRALGLDGYGRADFILGEDGSLTILEVNTLPGMTPASLVPKAAAAAGMTFPQFLQRLIDLGLAKRGR
ncbi:MAG: D-alanine--D-alanine ligase [Desulfovibrionaceae bacterium]|nr:D-alanine--D-alanine ligase [Desulfovibrionaceae bacterium]